MLHPPQFAGSVAVLAHPLAQHVSPAAHVPPSSPHASTHAPPTQTSPAAQIAPHWPQLFGSTSTSLQPLWQHDSLAWQARPALHVSGHIEFTQLPPYRQMCAHVPQLKLSWVVSMQPSEQHVWPEGQPAAGQGAGTQVPLRHVSSPGQGWAHAPQLCGSPRTSMQLSPIVASPVVVAQQLCPAEQVMFAHPTHAPETHESPVGQTFPQAPQLFTSVSIAAEQCPASGTTHSSVAGSHVSWGCPASTATCCSLRSVREPQPATSAKTPQSARAT
jgi:hypothetical protein